MKESMLVLTRELIVDIKRTGGQYISSAEAFSVQIKSVLICSPAKHLTDQLAFREN